MLLSNLVILASVLLSGPSEAVPTSIDTNNEIASLLNTQTWSPDAVLSFPGSSQFTNATARWNTRQAPTYAAALSVGSEEDVITAVKAATAHNISFLATGARHGFGATMSRLQDGLALDLSPLNAVTVDSTARTVTVGPGVRLRDIFEPVYNAGFQLQTGICTCVGMIGATIGAGIGRLQGTHGLMIDALVSVRLVTATGELLKVSSDTNRDLFWAVRGAAHNFGVITEATYLLRPLSEFAFTSVDMIFPAALGASFLEALAAFELTPEWAIAGRIVYDAVASEASIVVNCAYHGPLAEPDVLALLSPFLNLNPSNTTASRVPWNRINQEASYGSDTRVCEPGRASTTYAATLRTRTASAWVQTFELMRELYADVPDARPSLVLFEAWANQAVRAVPDKETAYPWRDAEAYVVARLATTATATSTAQEKTDAVGLKIREILFETSGYEDGAVYVNYALGDESLEQIYGARKLPRLAELKRRYDPLNVFGFHHPVPMEYP